MSDVNRQIHLAARPVGFPKESDFRLEEASMPSPGDGEFLVKTEYISVDPYMRGRMNDAHGYAEPFQIGQVITGGSAGHVVESKHPDFKEGDTVSGMWGWQDFTVSKGGGGLQKYDTGLAPLSASLGVLGMPGMTAYFGFLDICQPKEGESVYVSGAGGAVGELVGQIAKIKGCRVAGSAGTEEKIQYLLNEHGFDAAFNYKTSKDYVASLKEVCPDGIDCYFDNVGGKMMDAVLMSINPHARISICGAISQYNLKEPEMAPRLMTNLLVRQSRAEGFLVFQFIERYPEGMRQMAQWIQEGKIKYHETISEGLENTPKAFIGMLNGQNKGKQLVKV